MLKDKYNSRNKIKNVFEGALKIIYQRQFILLIQGCNAAGRKS